MRALFYTVLARLRGFVRPARAESDFDEEMRTHLAMAVEEKVRRGVSPADARRQAGLELGGVTQLRESAREARGLPWLDTFWLDAKLGGRMLRRSWGLTLVGGLAMAITIGLGASMLTIWDTISGTRIPLDEGDRVVAIQALDRASQQIERLTPIADFRRWRETLRSVEDVSAMRQSNHEVLTRDGALEPVRAAEMTASAFQLARVQPLMGRPLIDRDERVDALPVAVIGHRLWEEVFSSAPTVIGQTIDVGETEHTIVGVMPSGFRFPMNERLWIPLRGEEDVFVFGRLVPDATLERARTEVETIGLLPRQAARATAHLEPRVVPYAAGFFPRPQANRWLSGVIFLVGALLLVPPCANIAILVYARTVTRREEFSARSALGASRARIVMQVFVELLVLAAGAGLAGLLLAREYSAWLASLFIAMGGAPFWMDFTPSLETVAGVAGLSVLAAGIAGGMPALQATRVWHRSGLSVLGHARSGRARLGKVWMTLLATQVAMSLAILPSAFEMLWGVFRPAIVGPPLPVEEFLTAELALDVETARFGPLAHEIVRQLASQAGITGVTASSAVLLEESRADIDVEGQRGDEQASVNTVDGDFFDVLGYRFLAGRGFEAADFASGQTPIVVNLSFVNEVLDGTNALGRRVRLRASAPSAWHDVVGVVEDLPGQNDGPAVFFPMTTAVHPLSLTIRAPAGMGPAAGRLRAVAAGLDPRLRVERVRSLEAIFDKGANVDQTFGFAIGGVTTIVLLFSMAGMYTLMTFIVSQRWREIGVRTALGAQPRRLLAGIFGRAALPLVMGAVVGSLLGLRLNTWLPIAAAGGREVPGVILLSAAFMILVGLIAAAGPARRAIRIDPTEALRL